MKRNIITLLTDFGEKDPYVAAMKGVILTIAPHVKIIDITHNITKFNIREGAFILASIIKYFPRNTIHVGVVDPGVGSLRKPIIAVTKRSILIGPDNGLLMLAAEREGLLKVLEIRRHKFLLEEVSYTFHGRDIFAPVAAYIANGVKPEEIGEEVEEYVKLPFPKPRILKKKIIGEIIHIDDFGNIITNISIKELQKKSISIGSEITVEIHGEKEKLNLKDSYSKVEVEQTLAIIDSFNLLEIAVNQGNAARKYNVKVGEKITVTF
ncbi:MAG: S-adenosyl-l-methionine hydroxide adenosyltransferase family protein [archaeon GB-1867-035]|nr:S-adenosyl-l-methionine hydroxide adenosyltransferase family protein [Candidatus Culexmicrobium profundum]